MAGVEAEADPVAPIDRRERRPQPVDRLEPAGHGVPSSRGVLDEDRHRGVEPGHGLRPVLVAGPGVVLGGDVPAVDDDPERAEFGRHVDVLLEQSAARHADAVVGAGHVDDEGRVDDERQPSVGGRAPQRLRAAPVGEDGALPAPRIAEADLDDVGAARRGLADGVLLVDVGTDQD